MQTNQRGQHRPNGYEGIRLCDWTGGGDLRDESEDVIGCGDARRDVLTNGRVSSTN